MHDRRVSNPDSQGEPDVRFDGVSLSDGPEADVVADAPLQLTAGSMIFLTALSVAGRCTPLIPAYLALGPPTGKISLFGGDRSRCSRADPAPLRRRSGVVFQEFRLLDHPTAY